MVINLYATFRLLAGTKQIHLNLPENSTVRQALDDALRIVPALRPHWMNESGELHAHVHVLVNGQDVATLPQGLETPLQTSAVLDVFPPVAGG